MKYFLGILIFFFSTFSIWSQEIIALNEKQALVLASQAQKDKPVEQLIYSMGMASLYFQYKNYVSLEAQKDKFTEYLTKVSYNTLLFVSSQRRLIVSFNQRIKNCLEKSKLRFESGDIDILAYKSAQLFLEKHKAKKRVSDHHVLEATNKLGFLLSTDKDIFLSEKELNPCIEEITAEYGAKDHVEGRMLEFVRQELLSLKKDMDYYHDISLGYCQDLERIADIKYKNEEIGVELYYRELEKSLNFKLLYLKKVLSYNLKFAEWKLLEK